MKDKQFDIIYIKDDMSHIYEINEALKNKEFICIHGDRFVSKEQTFGLNFLGADARFPVGVFSIPLIYNVPVTFVFAVKESSSQYHFFATEPKYYSRENSQKQRKELAKEIAVEYAANLEKNGRRLSGAVV